MECLIEEGSSFPRQNYQSHSTQSEEGGEGWWGEEYSQSSLLTLPHRNSDHVKNPVGTEGQEQKRSWQMSKICKRIISCPQNTQ
jgi:hypothetical protein